MRGLPIRINMCLKSSDIRYIIRVLNLLAGDITVSSYWRFIAISDCDETIHPRQVRPLRTEFIL